MFILIRIDGQELQWNNNLVFEDFNEDHNDSEIIKETKVAELLIK